MIKKLGLLIGIFCLVEFSNSRVLSFNGIDYLKGNARQNQKIIVDAGIYNPLLGVSVEYVNPNINNYYFSVKFSPGAGLGNPISLIGGDGIYKHYSFGKKTYESKEMRDFFFVKQSYSMYGYGYTITNQTGYWVQGPVIHSKYFLVDVWQEQNGVYGQTKVSGGKEYKDYLAGENTYIVAKWRDQKDYKFIYDLSPVADSTITGPDQQMFDNITYFDVGVIAGLNLQQYGAWFELGMTEGWLALNIAMGLIYRLDTPKYVNDDPDYFYLSEPGVFGSFYLPWRISMGVNFDL